jgi:hypothetical protein
MTIAAKRADSPSDAPHSLQEASPTSGSKAERAAESDTSILATHENVELDSDKPVVDTPDDDSKSMSDRDSDFDLYMAEQHEKEAEKSMPLPPLAVALLEQNRLLITQLADQNKTLLGLFGPALTLCGKCGTECQKSGGSEKKKKTKKKKSEPALSDVHIVLRGLSLVLLLVVIAVQLGFIRGEGVFEGKRGRKTWIFGW